MRKRREHRGRTGKPRGRPTGSTKLAQLRKITAYQGLLDFFGEFEMRWWCIKRARAKGDYRFVQQALEDLADRAKGKAPQALHHMGAGGGVVKIEILGPNGSFPTIPKLLTAGGGGAPADPQVDGGDQA